VQFDETGNRKRKHRYGDEDEIEMEQQERKRRQMLNKEFRMFADKISEASSASVRVQLDFRFTSLTYQLRRAKHLTWTSHSENSLSKAFLTGPMFAFTQPPNVLSTFRILPS
jgi:hypothetical protein